VTSGDWANSPPAITKSTTRTSSGAWTSSRPKLRLQSCGREDHPERQRGLHCRRGRPGAPASSSWARRSPSSIRTNWLGRPVEVRRDHDRSSRTRPARICPLTTTVSSIMLSAADGQSCSTTKWEFNQSQYGPFPRQGSAAPRVRRNRSGQGTGSVPPPIPYSIPQPHRTPTLGRLGPERGSLFSGRKRFEIRGPGFHGGFVQRTIRARSRGSWWKRSLEKDVGSISGSACGVNCRPEPTERINCWLT